jgi:hypothetical protein
MGDENQEVDVGGVLLLGFITACVLIAQGYFVL